MKFLRNLEKILNDKTKDYKGAQELGLLWEKHLKNTPWADRTSLLDSMTYEECVIFPIFQNHYEILLIDDAFSLRHHPSWSGNCSSKPSEGGIRDLLKTFEISYDELLEETKKLPPLFHNAFYKGPVENFEKEPPLPEIVKRLIDRTVSGCYWNLYEETSVQWAFQLNVKIYNLFTNKSLKVEFDITSFDNGGYAEGFWPIKSLYPLNSSQEREQNCPTSLELPPNPALNSYQYQLHNLSKMYNARLDELFSNQESPRMELPEKQFDQFRNVYVRPELTKNE